MARVAHLTTVHNVRDPRIFHKECVTLREAGFDVHLIAPHTRDEVRHGVRITALPQVTGRYRRMQLHPRAFRAARALRADLYHFHDPELIPVAYALKRFTGARVIYDMHEDYRAGRGLEGVLLRALERWCFRWADHVVISDAAYHSVTAVHGVPTTLVANYFKPPDDVVVSDTPVLDGRFRPIYTGVMSTERGLFHLLDLAREIRRADEDWRLELAGVCYVEADRHRAESRIHREKLHEVVRRTGWDSYLPWPALMTRCREAHVGLVLWQPRSGRTDKIPTKFYEYLHCGLPILCSDFPLWRQFVEQHGCGAVVPPGDARAALQVLRRWVEDPARYRRFSEAARAAAPQFRWAPMGERLVRLYWRLV